MGFTDEEKAASAERASQNVEIMLSHHLQLVDETMDLRSSIGKVHRRKYFATKARDCLPSLMHIANYLLRNTRVIDLQTSETVADVDWSTIQLRVLQKLTGLWITDKFSVPPPTLEELHEVL